MTTPGRSLLRIAAAGFSALTLLVGCHSESISGVVPSTVVPLVNKVVFDSDRDDLNGDLYSIDLTDRSVVRLTTSPFQDFCPAVSPDGLRIAFYSSRLGGQVSLFVMYADGTGAVYVDGPVNSVNCPTWSKNGSRVLYLRHESEGGDISTLRTVAANGTGIRTIAGPAFFNSAFPSPDGSQVVFNRYVQNDPSHTGVFIGSTQGQPEAMLRQSDGYLASVSWSPDASTIAYLCPPPPPQVNGDEGMCLSTPGGLNARRIDFGPGTYMPCESLEWSPGGSEILCPASGGLNLINVGTGSVSGVSIGQRPEWSADGTRLAFVTMVAQSSDIFVVNKDGSGFSNLTNDDSRDDHPSFGPSK